MSLARSDERNCFETKDIAQAHLNTVRAKLKELRALERSLARFVDSCSQLCAGGSAAQCSILKDLSLANSLTAAKAGRSG